MLRCVGQRCSAHGPHRHNLGPCLAEGPDCELMSTPSNSFMIHCACTCIISRHHRTPKVHVRFVACANSCLIVDAAANCGAHTAQTTRMSDVSTGASATSLERDTASSSEAEGVDANATPLPLLHFLLNFCIVQTTPAYDGGVCTCSVCSPSLCLVKSRGNIPCTRTWRMKSWHADNPAVSPQPCVTCLAQQTQPCIGQKVSA